MMPFALLFSDDAPMIMNTPRHDEILTVKRFKYLRRSSSLFLSMTRSGGQRRYEVLGEFNEGEEMFPGS
jgi:hypothetical protein